MDIKLFTLPLPFLIHLGLEPSFLLCIPLDLITSPVIDSIQRPFLYLYTSYQTQLVTFSLLMSAIVVV